MAEDTSLFSPTNPHFFQPLLPGFKSHLKVPVKFFSKHIKGKHEGKTVKLRSDASDKTWNVKMENQRLTNGWKEFVEAHDLRIGDFVVFRQEQDMLFHVTALGPSCCEIHYTDEEESDETERSSRSEKDVETRESNKTSLDSDLTCFNQYVTVSNLSRDLVGVPKAFANRNGLNKGNQKIVLMNEEGKSWPSELKSHVDRVVIFRNWRIFCIANKLKPGDSCTFKLLENAETPVFRLCSSGKTERKKETLFAESNIAEKPIENRFLELTPTSNSLITGKQHLPASFTRVNRLIKPGKISLVDKNGAEWLMEVKVDKRSGLMYIYSSNGWRSFCDANEVSAGESLTLELIREGENQLLKFCSKMKQPPFGLEARASKRARFEKRSQENRPKVEVSEKIFEEGEPSNKSIECNLPRTQPCSVSAKAKQIIVDTLTSIQLFRQELETMKQRLEDLLQEFNSLERRTQWS